MIKICFYCSLVIIASIFFGATCSYFMNTAGYTIDDTTITYGQFIIRVAQGVGIATSIIVGTVSFIIMFIIVSTEKTTH